MIVTTASAGFNPEARDDSSADQQRPLPASSNRFPPFDKTRHPVTMEQGWHKDDGGEESTMMFNEPPHQTDTDRGFTSEKDGSADQTSSQPEREKTPRPTLTRDELNDSLPSGFTIAVEWYDTVFADDDPAHPLSDDEMRAKIYEMLGKAGPQGGYLPAMKSGVVRTVSTGPKYMSTQEYRPGFGRTLEQDAAERQERMDNQDAKMLEDGYTLETRPGGGRTWSKPMSMEEGAYAAERMRTGNWGKKTKTIIVGDDVRTIEVSEEGHAED